MKKKPYKIVKSEIFKKQEKKLPAKVKKSLDKALKNIAKNPMHMLGSMQLFSDPSVDELKQWMSGGGHFKVIVIDLLFEYLKDKDCLTDQGKKLSHDFWKQYIWEGRNKKVKS